MQSLTDELLELASDTVTVEPSMGADEYGTALPFGPPVSYRVRIVGRSKITLDQDGVEKISGAQIIFFGEFGLTANDRYTLPLRFSANPSDATDLAARQPKALSVDRESDENGAHHTTVYFSISRLRSY